MKYQNLKKEGIKLVKSDVVKALETIRMIGVLIKSVQMQIQVENLNVIKDYMGYNDITKSDVEEALNLIDEEMSAFEEIQELAESLFDKIKNFGNGIY